MSAENTVKLLPCPFCGGEVKLIHDDEMGHYIIECNNHAWGNYLETPDMVAADILMVSWRDTDESRRALTEAWNTRYERTCRITDEEPIEIPDQDSWYGMLDTGITRYKLSCGHDTLSADYDGPKRCCECGAKVVEQ